MVVESNMREMMMETVCTGPVSHTGSSCYIAQSPATLFSVCQELTVYRRQSGDDVLVGVSPVCDLV